MDEERVKVRLQLECFECFPAMELSLFMHLFLLEKLHDCKSSTLKLKGLNSKNFEEITSSDSLYLKTRECSSL